MVNIVSVLFLLPSLEELHGEVDPSQVSALYRQVSGPGRSHAEQEGVAVVLDLLGRHVNTNVDSGLENDPLVSHQIQSSLDHFLGEFHRGDAVHEEAARPVVPLVHRDGVASLVELICRSQT